jgi:hypothetical protein
LRHVLTELKLQARRHDNLACKIQLQMVTNSETERQHKANSQMIKSALKASLMRSSVPW